MEKRIQGKPTSLIGPFYNLNEANDFIDRALVEEDKHRLATLGREEMKGYTNVCYRIFDRDLNPQ